VPGPLKPTPGGKIPALEGMWTDRSAAAGGDRSREAQETLAREHQGGFIQPGHSFALELQTAEAACDT
jgi:hypothetical protein